MEGHFLELSWLSIDTSASNLETNPTVPTFFYSLTFWKSVRNQLPTCKSVRYVMKSWDSRQSSETWQVWVEEPNQSQFMRMSTVIGLLFWSYNALATFENMVFISCTYILVIHGELDEMLTPRLLILQLHFQLWYLIFTGPQAPNSLVMKTSFQRTWAKKLPN